MVEKRKPVSKLITDPPSEIPLIFYISLESNFILTFDYRYRTDDAVPRSSTSNTEPLQEISSIRTRSYSASSSYAMNQPQTLYASPLTPSRYDPVYVPSRRSSSVLSNRSSKVTFHFDFDNLMGRQYIIL